MANRLRLRCPHCGEIDWALAPELRDTLRLVVARASDFTARDIADTMRISIANASNRMRALADMEMIVGERVGNPSGGIQYVYRVTKLGRDSAPAPSRTPR